MPNILERSARAIERQYPRSRDAFEPIVPGNRGDSAHDAVTSALATYTVFFDAIRHKFNKMRAGDDAHELGARVARPLRV